MKYIRIVTSILILFAAAFIAGGETVKKDFQNFGKESRLEDLSAPVRCFFDAAALNDSKALVTCFSDEVTVNIAGMRFDGLGEVAAFAERDIWGGKYRVEKVFKQKDKEIVHCLFWPRGWSAPEPAIEYQFETKNGKIVSWHGEYR